MALDPPPPLPIARTRIWEIIETEIADRRLHRGFMGQVLPLQAQDGTTLIRLLYQSDQVVIVPRFGQAVWYGEPHMEMHGAWFDEIETPTGTDWIIRDAPGIREEIMTEFIRAYGRWLQGQGRY